MALPEIQKFKKHRSAPQRFMKLFVVVKDNHILHLKKESSLSSFVESGNWILKKNKSLNAYSISLGNARTKIQLSSERSKSNLSFEPKNVCIAWKMCELCVFEDEAIFWKSPNPQIPKFYQCVIPGHCATACNMSLRNLIISVRYRLTESRHILCLVFQSEVCI